MTATSVDWETLRGRFSHRLVDVLREHIDGSAPLRLTAAFLAAQTNCKEDEALRILDAVATADILKKRDGFECPCDERQELEAGEAAGANCPRAPCTRSFEDAKPLRVTFFERQAPPTRDVPWVLALHGMNTRGAWQEALSWHLAMAYRHSVPVFIYKYGVIRPGVLFEFRQKQLRDELIARIREVTHRARGAGYGGRPDVIAHSFGTWLLGHALERDPEIRLGRVVLTGCILRPDFDWTPFLRAGQVEAVLCHTGGRDFWARIAHYFIPDSGPSGRQGFNDRRNVLHEEASSFRHSDFFDEHLMPDVFKRVWTPFLTAAQETLALRMARVIPRAPWKPASRLMRAGILRVAVLLLVTALVLFLGASLLIGAGDLLARIL